VHLDPVIKQVAADDSGIAFLFDRLIDGEPKAPVDFAQRFRGIVKVT